MKNNKGITLVSLVITIIVMLILAGVSLSMVVGDNSVLKQASKATISKKLSEIKEEFQVEGLGSSITSYVKRTKRELDEACVMGDDLEKYIPGIDEVYKEKVAIFNGELVFLKAGATEEELQILRLYWYAEKLSVCNRLSNHTASACYAKAISIGLINSNRWTEDEDNIIRKYYPTEGSNIHKRLNNRTLIACRDRAAKLGVKYKYN